MFENSVKVLLFTVVKNLKYGRISRRRATILGRDSQKSKVLFRDQKWSKSRLVLGTWLPPCSTLLKPTTFSVTKLVSLLFNPLVSSVVRYRSINNVRLLGGIPPWFNGDSWIINGY